MPFNMAHIWEKKNLFTFENNVCQLICAKEKLVSKIYEYDQYYLSYKIFIFLIKNHKKFKKNKKIIYFIFLIF